MKINKIIYFTAFFMLLSFSVSAQMHRGVGRQQYKNNKKKAEKVDYIQQTVDYLEKELSLDTFQTAAVKEIIENERGAFTALGENSDLQPNERRDKNLEIFNRIDSKMIPLLSDEQAKKYQKLKDKKK